MATGRAKYDVEDNSEQIEKILDRIGENGFTALQDHFGNWVAEKTGLDFKSKAAEQAFAEGAKYALALRMEHQRSPENDEFQKERAEAREAAREERVAATAERKEARAAARQEKEDAAAEKRAARQAKKAEKDSDADTEEPAPKPKRGRPARSAKTDQPAKTEAKEPASSRRPARRPARGKASAEAEF